MNQTPQKLPLIFSWRCLALMSIQALAIFTSDLRAQSILMDFGTTLTINPTNGLTWNNYTNNTFLNLVTSQSNSTSYYFTPKTGGSFNINFVPVSANLSALAPSTTSTPLPTRSTPPPTPRTISTTSTPT